MFWIHDKKPYEIAVSDLKELKKELRHLQADIEKINTSLENLDDKQDHETLTSGKGSALQGNLGNLKRDLIKALSTSKSLEIHILHGLQFNLSGPIKKKLYVKEKEVEKMTAEQFLKENMIY